MKAESNAKYLVVLNTKRKAIKNSEIGTKIETQSANGLKIGDCPSWILKSL